MAYIQYVGAGSSEGVSLGQSGEKIGFFGTVTTVQAITAVGTTTATTTLNETKIDRLYAAFRAYGIITTGG